MPVSGVVVTCAPGRGAGVAREIACFTGIEVHGVLPDDRIIAVVEADSVDGEVDLVGRVHEVNGVASVGLAYHNFEQL